MASLQTIIFSEILLCEYLDMVFLIYEYLKLKSYLSSPCKVLFSEICDESALFLFPAATRYQFTQTLQNPQTCPARPWIRKEDVIGPVKK